MEPEIKWEHLPPDDINNFVRHAKKNGYVDRWGTIRMNFDDLVALMKKLGERGEQAKKCTCGAFRREDD